MDLWINMAISVVLTALQAAVKNPDSKEKMKRAFRKVFVTILLVYPDFADEIQPKEVS